MIRPALVRLLPLCLGMTAAGCTDPDFHSIGDPSAHLLPVEGAQSTAPAAATAAEQDAGVPVDEGGEQESGGRVRVARPRRCGECHDEIYQEWRGSAHAAAGRSAAFRTALHKLPAETQAACRSCHLPLSRNEGVSCDACHTLRQVVVDEVRATPAYDRSSGKRYGPLVGASGHYFHDMAYSALHKRSELCASCHHLMAFTLAGETRNIPVVTDYTGWKRYGRERTCQACHMPSRGSVPVARGERPRPDVAAHTFAGPAELGKLLKLEIATDRKDGVVTVELSHAAGHPLPGGHPDRRLLLRARFYSRTGALLAAEERVYGLLLSDAEGRPAPFFAATAVKEDRRLLPGRVYREAFKIPGVQDEHGDGHAARVVIAVLAASTAEELQATYGDPDQQTLRTVTYPLSLAAPAAGAGNGG